MNFYFKPETAGPFESSIQIVFYESRYRGLWKKPQERYDVTTNCATRVLKDRLPMLEFNMRTSLARGWHDIAERELVKTFVYDWAYACPAEEEAPEETGLRRQVLENLHDVEELFRDRIGVETAGRLYAQCMKEITLSQPARTMQDLEAMEQALSTQWLMPAH